MDIKNLGGVNPLQPRKIPGEADRAQEPKKAQGPQDRVDLSPEARLLSRASKLVDQTAEVRQQRVNEVLTQIAEGNFEVNTQAIAKALLRGEIVDGTI